MSATAKAHGMDGTLVEPDWPPLTLDELRPLLRQFPELGEPTQILSVSPRPFSAAGVVATHNGRSSAFSSSAIIAPCAIAKDFSRSIAFLRICLHMARLCRASWRPRAGETAIEVGEWTYEVHEIPAGIDLYEDAHLVDAVPQRAHAYSAGAALARLHLAAQNFNAPRRKPRPLVASFTIFAADDPAAAMKHYLAARPSLAANKAVCAFSAQQALRISGAVSHRACAASARARTALDPQRPARL